jgi:hypothetical protein
MPNAGFAVASALALITFAVHAFVGGIYVVRLLLASGADKLKVP